MTPPVTNQPSNIIVCSKCQREQVASILGDKIYCPRCAPDEQVNDIKSAIATIDVAKLQQWVVLLKKISDLIT